MPWRVRALLALNGLQICDEVIQTQVGQVGVPVKPLIGLDAMKDGSKNGHFARAVRGQNLNAGNHLSHAIRRKLAAVILRYDAQVGNFRFQGRSSWTIPFSVSAMAGES